MQAERLKNSVKNGIEFQKFEPYFLKDFSEIVDLNLVPNLILVSLRPVCTLNSKPCVLHLEPSQTPPSFISNQEKGHETFAHK